METLRSCEMYDPQADAWEAASPLGVRRSGLRVVALGRQHMAAVGGCEDVYGHHVLLDTIEVYDAAMRQWNLLDTRLQRPRAAAAVVALGGRLFAAGGGLCETSAELSGPVLPAAAGEDLEPEMECHDLQDLPEGRVGCQAAVVALAMPATFPCDLRGGARSRQRCILVVGGEHPEAGGSRRLLSSVIAYSIEAEHRGLVVMGLPSMKVPRSSAAACLGSGHSVVASTSRGPEGR